MTVALSIPDDPNQPHRFKHLIDAWVYRARRLGAFLGGRPRIFRNPADKEQALTLLANGERVKKVAKLFSCSEMAIYRLIANNRDVLIEKQSIIQAVAAEKVLIDIGEATTALMATAKDSGNRAQPQAYLAALQGAGLGPKGNQTNHFHGDVSVSIDTIDARSITITDEMRAEMDTLEQELGF